MKTGEIWVFNHTKGESAVLVMDKIMSCNHTQGGDYWYAHCFDSLRANAKRQLWISCDRNYNSRSVI